MQEIRRAREEVERARAERPKRVEGAGMVLVEKKKVGRKRKRVHGLVEEQREREIGMPELVFDPDECGTAAQAYSILKSLLSPPSVKPPRAPKIMEKINIRLTWAVVADGSISHRSRIESVVRELRKIGLKFGYALLSSQGYNTDARYSSVGKTQEPGSRYARHNSITEKYRCKCTVSPSSSSSKPTPAKALARRQSDLSTFFNKPQPKAKGALRMEEEEDEDVLMLVPPSFVKANNNNDGGGAEEEKCGGNVYVSSEWDVKSHPAGVRGQRVVVWVVHEQGEDPIQ